MNNFPQQNTGVLEGQRPTDFIAGQIPYEVRVQNGDWRPYLPKEEKQYSQNTDTMGCVSFSLNNSAEMQHKQQTGKDVNFSDRFLAKMSNTTPQGNYLYIVADTARLKGLVLEEEWPEPDNYTWASYYSDIPDSVIAKAQKFDVAYEWVDPNVTSLLKHLRHAPIQITIPGQNPNHAVVLVAIEGNRFIYFDTYAPYLKTMTTPPASALKVVFTIKKPEMTVYRLNSKGKLGVAFEEGFTLTGLYAKDMAQYEALCKAYGITEQTPLITLP